MCSTAKNKIQLTPHQETVKAHVLNSVSTLAISALLGAAGTGKTTLMGEIVKEIERVVCLMAPTHKAASVLAEKTGKGVKTIHSWLGLRPDTENASGFKRMGPSKLPPNAVYILDEASMAGTELLDYLAKEAQEKNSKILLIGDEAQLPPVLSVGGIVFEDYARQHGGPKAVARLTEIVRQAKGSAIPEIAHEYRDPNAEFAMPAASVIRPDGSLIIRDFGEAIPEFVEACATNAVTATDRVFLSYTNARVDAVNQMVRVRQHGDKARFTPFFAGELMISFTAVPAQDDLPELGKQQHVRILSAERSDIVTNGIRTKVWAATVEPILSGGAVDDPLTVLATDYATRKTLMDAANAHARKLEAEFMRGIRANNLMREWQTAKKGGDRAFRALAARHNLAPNAIELNNKRRAAWRHYYNLESTLIDLRAPHALTVHRAQGSTYTQVWIDGYSISRAPGRRALMYTALTRTSKDVHLLMDNWNSEKGAQ